MMVMSQAKISELKAKLSAYVARVRRGATVTIMDRDTPVAKLVPIDAEPGIVLREAKKPLKPLAKIAGVKIDGSVDVVALLRADRDQ